MIPLGRRFIQATLLATFICNGCVHSVPHVAWDKPADALAIIKRRAEGVRTFSATGRLRLKKEDGSVELTTAVVAEPPDHLRIRAWKFSQAVFDITMNEDGVFVWAKNDGDAAPVDHVTHEGLVQVASFLPGFCDYADWNWVDTHGHTLLIQQQSKNDSSLLRCEVDKETLTKTRCDFLDEANQTRQTLTFDRYVLVSDVIWPMHLQGRGEGGEFELLFDDVEINTDLPPRAFIPPRQAVRQP